MNETIKIELTREQIDFLRHQKKDFEESQFRNRGHTRTTEGDREDEVALRLINHILKQVPTT